MEMGAGVVAAVTLVPCACGCGRVVLPIYAHRFATVHCRERGATCRRCRKAPATAGCVTCQPCREAHRLVVARQRATEQLDARFAGAGDVEAKFQAAKAQLRRDLRVDPWGQRMPYARYMDR